jgi:hypothetical protein
MKRALFAVAAAAFALVVGTMRADAAPTVSAAVDSIATVSGAVTTHFEFDVYNCPAGADLVIADWEAHQPSRPESIAVSGFQPYGISNGDAVQHLTLLAASGSFLAGEQWVGSGTILCGAVAIPVEGQGQTKSLNGI